MPDWSIKEVHPDLPYLVDQFNEDCEKKLQFLTHAHKDHTQGIEQFGTRIVCTRLTKQLVQLRHPRLAGRDDRFQVLHDDGEEGAQASLSSRDRHSTVAVPVPTPRKAARLQALLPHASVRLRL